MDIQHVFLVGAKSLGAYGGDCEIIRCCHNRNKGQRSMKGRFCPKFIFSYPKVDGKRVSMACGGRTA